MTFEQFETAEASSLSDSNNWFNSRLKTESSIICGSIYKNEITYIDNEDISLLTSTVITENTVEKRTKINLFKNSLINKTITSNHDRDDNSTDNKQIEQTVYNNPKENVNPIINNEVALPNSQQVSLRDALEVVLRPEQKARVVWILDVREELS